ncbi:glycosyltransferase [Rothia sp. P5764]|uniref:glycosyltransferase n=1 Tax=Rothia sp. P5764 TaxID=3402654 RepID=UPI003AC78C0A
MPKKLYLFWTGDNPLTKNRKNSFDYLVKNNDDIEVILVSNDNLKDFIVPGHPLHDCYYDLSFVHRSDYLRAYFMYHHGGAYLDIKPFEGRVSRMIDYLENHKSIWAVGEAEVYGTGEMPKGGALQRDSELHYSRTLSQMCFAFRPQTAFAAEWLTEVERRINYFSSDLVRFPARGATGTDNPDYPAPWFSLLSAICLPLCLKYYNKIYVGNFVGLRPGSIESYR